MTGNTLDYHKTYPNLPWSIAESLRLQSQTLWAVQEIRDHLEAQNPPAETQQSGQPSSQATATATETSDTYRTFWSKSYPANLGLIDWRPAARDISAWLSSLPILGNELEVEIGVTLTSKASTPHAGSPSPSTAAPAPEASGAAGEWMYFYSPEMGNYVCRDDGKDTPSKPCFYMRDRIDAILLSAVLNRAVLAALPASTSPVEDASREGRECLHPMLVRYRFMAEQVREGSRTDLELKPAQWCGECGTMFLQGGKELVPNWVHGGSR